MKKIFFLVAVIAAIVVAGLVSAQVKKASPASGNVKMVTHSAMNSGEHQLHSAMNKLWEDHVTWTRNVIFCLVDNLPGKDEALKRLLQNQTDIGNAIKPYYGEEAGEKLTALLKQHIIISADVVNGAKAGDNAALEAANKKWYGNADEISEFLSKANPKWGLSEMKEMMHDHLKLTTDEAVARIKKDYSADVSAYDKVHNEILKMAGMLADGIVEQFPAKFGKTESHKKVMSQKED